MFIDLEIIMIPIQTPQQVQQDFTKSCNNAIQKLKRKTLLIKNQQKRQLRERAPTSAPENKFKNFMRKWNEAKKSQFKSVIPSTLYKAISSSEYIDLKGLNELQLKQSEQDYLKVQTAIKFYTDEVKGLGTMGQHIFQKLQQGLNQYNNKNISTDHFNLNLFEESDINPYDNKSHDLCHSPRDQFDKL